MTPSTEAELLERSRRLAGVTLGALARQLGAPVPAEPKRGKGWAGQLLERALEATASSRAAPDFEGLGVELKTLPVDRTGRPLESTFVCTIDLRDVGSLDWETSRAHRKLARVLWVPVLAERTLPMGERVIGTSLLWSPSADDEAVLRADWEELAGLCARGHYADITGHLGRYLQIRPKAANARARRRTYDEEGAPVDELPRGFYLRPQFTARLLRDHFALPR